MDCTVRTNLNFDTLEDRDGSVVKEEHVRVGLQDKNGSVANNHYNCPPWLLTYQHLVITITDSRRSNGWVDINVVKA
jgi:hypothetical protein